MGLTMKERQAVTGEYKPRYQKATKKSKQALLDEFTRLTGYHRKSAVRLLAAKPPTAALIYVDGKPVKLKPEKKRPANRKGKRVYSDETIRCLRLVWAFFWYKCGKILAPFMRQQMPFIAQWQAFGITPEIAEQLCPYRNFTATTARSSSTTPPKSGAKPSASRLPAAATIKKMTIVLSNKKTALWFGNTSATTGSRVLRNRRSSPPSTGPWFRC